MRVYKIVTDAGAHFALYAENPNTFESPALEPDEFPAFAVHYCYHSLCARTDLLEWNERMNEPYSVFDVTAAALTRYDGLIEQLQRGEPVDDEAAFELYRYQELLEGMVRLSQGELPELDRLAEQWISELFDRTDDVNSEVQHACMQSFASVGCGRDLTERYGDSCSFESEPPSIEECILAGRYLEKLIELSGVTADDPQSVLTAIENSVRAPRTLTYYTELLDDKFEQ